METVMSGGSLRAGGSRRGGLKSSLKRDSSCASLSDQSLSDKSSSSTQLALQGLPLTQLLDANYRACLAWQGGGPSCIAALAGSKSEDVSDACSGALAVAVVCQDCELPMEWAFGDLAHQVRIIGARGPVILPEVVSAAAATLERTQAPLLLVCGHDRCAAAGDAIRGWLDASKRPVEEPASPSYGPVPPLPKSKSRGAFSCLMMGASWDEDESHHVQPDRSNRSGKGSSKWKRQPLNEVLVDTLRPAVEEVAEARLEELQRLRIQQWTADLRTQKKGEAAVRQYDPHSGVSATFRQSNAASAQKEPIRLDEDTERCVVACNTRQATRHMLRGLAKTLHRQALQKLTVVGLHCNSSTAALTVECKAWYAHACYYFE